MILDDHRTSDARWFLFQRLHRVVLPRPQGCPTGVAPTLVPRAAVAVATATAEGRLRPCHDTMPFRPSFRVFLHATEPPPPFKWPMAPP